MLARNLLVNDKVTALYQRNISPKALHQTKMNLEKLSSKQVFKNCNCNLFQSSSTLSISASFFIC